MHVKLASAAVFLIKISETKTSGAVAVRQPPPFVRN